MSSPCRGKRHFAMHKLPSAMRRLNSGSQPYRVTSVVRRLLDTTAVHTYFMFSTRSISNIPQCKSCTSAPIFIDMTSDGCAFAAGSPSSEHKSMAAIPLEQIAEAIHQHSLPVPSTSIIWTPFCSLPKLPFHSIMTMYCQIPRVVRKRSSRKHTAPNKDRNWTR